ncbi:MAG: hypothetical protein JKX75_00435 [Gammaproteobacteria bacterium]|nr:hypothetical protein [Gammaproteobacteria bacterium]
MNLKTTTLIVMIVTFIHLGLNLIKYLSVVLGEGQLKIFDLVTWTSGILSSIGFCVFLFVFYKSLASQTEDLSAEKSLSHNKIDGSQNNKWEFDWVNALVGMGVAGLFLGMVGGKYIIAGSMSEGVGELAVSIGLVIIIMVGIIVGYGIKLIKRK